MPTSNLDISHAIKSALFGVAVRDALGVPVEFISRESLKVKRVTDMVGYGTHHQPPGTWSDDSSLTFCLAEALTKDFSLNNIANNFIKRYREKYWTARGIFSILELVQDTQSSILKMELTLIWQEEKKNNQTVMAL